MTHEKERSGFVGPFILVGIGLLFLLNNLGVIHVNFWRLASTLWPVVLIGIGLDMLIGKRSTAGSLFALLLTAIFLVGGVFYMGVEPGSTPRGETREIRYAPGDVTEADIHISTSTGRLELGAMAERDVLVEGTVRLVGGEELQEERRIDGSKGIYRLSSEGVSVVGVSGNETVWDIHINGEIPTELHVGTGAGEAELSLQRMRLTALDVDLGIGATTITLPRSGVFNGTIDGGIGKLVIRVPDSLAARLRVDTGIGQVQVDENFTTAGENAYLSPGAQNGGERATLQISSGIGQVVIESLAGE